MAKFVRFIEGATHNSVGIALYRIKGAYELRVEQVETRQPFRHNGHIILPYRVKPKLLAELQRALIVPQNPLAARTNFIDHLARESDIIEV